MKMAEVRLKVATIEDSETAVGIDYRLDQDEHIRLNRMDKISKAIAENSCYMIIASNENVGFLIFDYRFFDQGWIELLIIDEEHRGKGIGVKAIELICKHCITSKLFTSTNRSNLRMQRALEKVEFIFAGELIGLDSNDPECFYYKHL